MDKQQAKAIKMEQMGWSEAEFNERVQWVWDNCICGDCPSFIAEETELGFCRPTTGQSEHISVENDCVCGQCPVFNQSGLRTAYYCIRGSEIEQLDELSRAGGQEAVA